MIASDLPRTDSNLHKIDHSSSGRGKFPVPVYQATIFQNEDGVGYYAKCSVDDDSCAFTCGDTIGETQANMYESFALLIEDDYPDIADFFLEFVLAVESNE